MRLFGLEILTRKGHMQREKALQSVSGRGGWSSVLGEPYAGAWQLNDELSVDTQLAYYAVYSCITLIANDIGKLPPKHYQKQDGIKVEVFDKSITPLLKNPNKYQNHIQFKEWWMLSKLSRGNTYALKQRDANGRVIALHLLDTAKVCPLVSDDGQVFYQLTTDNLSGISSKTITVPASEVIHDRMNCLFHPLVGISPLYACALSAGQGIAILRNSKNFFNNASRPGGILTAPGSISDETAERLKEYWQENFSGNNSGKVAAVGDGLQYTPMVMNATDSQMVEQLKMTGEVVCSVFHVPSHMAIAGQTPNYNNIEALNLQYYSQCLQSLIEQFEAVMNDGLGLEDGKGVELDLEALLRMDTATQVKVAADEMKAGYISPDEARRRRNLPPVEGGSTPYMQQQNYSLAALARRDSLEDPFNPQTQDSVTDEEALEALAEGANE
jgi:HK97 family phage portal protein